MFAKFIQSLGQQVADAVANGGDKAIEATTEAQETISSLTQVSDNEMINKALSYGVSVIGALLLFIVGLMVAKGLKKVAIKAAKKGLRDDGSLAVAVES